MSALVSRRRSQVEREEIATLQSFDLDGDGLLGQEEVAKIMRKYVSMRYTRDLLRRALCILMTFIVVALMVTTLISVITTFGVKSTTVSDEGGSRLTKYSFSDTEQLVSTGIAEEVFEVSATRDAFDSLQQHRLFVQRPRLVLIEFSDGSVVQFPPEIIQAFPSSATYSNDAIGVSLLLAKGKLPQVHFVGGVDGVTFVEPQVPTGPYDALEVAARPAPRVALIRMMYEDHGQNVTKLAPQDDEGDADEGDAPVDQAGADKAEQQLRTRNIKDKLIPLHEQSLVGRASAEGRVLRGRLDHWQLLLGEPGGPPGGMGAAPGVSRFDLRPALELCKRLEGGVGVAGRCGFSPEGSLEERWAAMSKGVAITGVVDVSMPVDQLQKLRELMRNESNPYDITAIQKAYLTTSQSFSASAMGEHQPLHDTLTHELRRSTHELLASTPAGLGVARRMAEKLFREQEQAVGEEEHRRQLYSWYNRDKGKTVAGQSCYRSTEPGMFEGREVTTTCISVRDKPYDGCSSGQRHTCLPWEEVFKHPECRKNGVTSSSPTSVQVKCICEGIIGGEPRPWKMREVGGRGVQFEGNFPRSLCQNLPDRFASLEGRPTCFYRKPWAEKSDWAKANGQGLALAPGAVLPCFVEYYNSAKKMYGRGYTSVAPLDSSWAWFLSRITTEGGRLQYGSERNFNDLAYTGKRVHIFVIDSGINFRHTEFEGRIGKGINCINPDKPRYCDPRGGEGAMRPCDDSHGHGSHVSSIVAGKTHGIARGATVHPVRVGKTLQGVFSAKVVEFVVEECEKLGDEAYCIVVFSQGTPPGTYSDSLEQLIVHMINNGISVVTSAGNANGDSCSASPNRLVGGKASIVVVGATNVDDSVASYSNYGSCVTVHAPGTGVLGAKKWVRTGFRAYQGTSQACPVVAGILALAADVQLDAYLHGEGARPTPASLLSWVRRTALRGKIRGLSPNRFVPEWAIDVIKEHLDFDDWSFWNDMIEPKGTNTKKFSGSNRLAYIPKTFFNRARRLALSHGAHEPRELASDDEIAVCSDTVLEPEGECPAEGALICGLPTGTAPDGSELLRPFRRIRTACAEGCSCNASALVNVTYESCAADPCAYTYTGEACKAVFNVTSPQEAGQLSGAQLRFVPLADGSGFNEPEVSFHKQIIARLADTGQSGVFELGGLNMKHEAAQDLGMNEEEVVKVSIPSSTFRFLDGEFDAINVAANGYVGFDQASLSSIVSTPSYEDHFEPAKGRSFSLMLADLSPPNVFVAHLEQVLGEVDGEERTEPYATVVTYLDARLAFDTSAAGNTVQAMFEHASGAITVTFGEVSNNLDAVVGHSTGSASVGDRPAVVQYAHLLSGSLSSSPTTSSACNDAAGE